MPSVRPVTEEEIDRLAAAIDVAFAGGEAADAADRVNTLLDIYEGLEEAPVGVGGEPGGDLFETRPYRPNDGEDPHNAWITKFDLARPEAEGALSGLEVGIKDNTCVRGAEMTLGSRAFEGFAPAEHAEVTERVLDAGGRIVGKTNMDEVAFGPTSETSAFGPTENPRDTGHAAGGSSSGSAAAVAAGEVDLALGSDTGGSVRIPASYCGIVGLKPTYGRVPRYGFADLAYSMDHVGPLARDVETAALGFDAISDPPPGGESYADDLGLDPADLTIGIEERFFEEHVSDGVDHRVREAVARFEDAGATVREVEVPSLAYSREAWWGICPPEFAAMYATNGTGLWNRAAAEPSLAAAMRRVRRASSREFGANIKEMLALGAYLNEVHDGAHYVRAGRLREAITREFDAALSEVDLLAAPGTPTTALELGEFDRGTTPPVNWDTHPTNLTGHPSISIPCGEAGGLPVGLQFMGAWHDERTVLDAAYTYEQGL